MTKQLTQKDQVAIFVRYQPNCAVGDVSDALDLGSSTAGKLLRALTDEGIVIRSHNGTQFTYEAIEGAAISDELLPCMLHKADPAKTLAAETLAKELEAKGLWRRAAAVYSGMLEIAVNAVEVGRIAKRRDACLQMSRGRNHAQA